MTSKITDAVETVKDAILPSPTYKTTRKKFRTAELFAKTLIKGDTVVAKQEIAAMVSFGIPAGSSHEIVKIEGQILHLKGGKQIMAEWFVPEISRRERIRRKADRETLVRLATQFALGRWDDFRSRLDKEITDARAAVVKQQEEVTRAQNKLKQAQDSVASLEKAKLDGNVWPSMLSAKLVALVDQKVFTNFEQTREGDLDVFIAYTGPLWIEPQAPVPAGVAKPEKVRGEYAMKIYPSTAKLRIVVENIAPGKLPTDVPYNQLQTGSCNICFGGQNDVIHTLIQNEDWTRALTMVRVYLEGNRSN
jgi:hypothetical protein